MTTPVSYSNMPINNQQNPTAPIGAFGISSSNKKFEAGHFVVNPPAQIYKYSIYDDLSLGQDRFNEILSAVESKTSTAKRKRITKRDMLLQKIFNWGCLIGLGVLTYKYRNGIKNILQNVYNRIK